MLATEAEPATGTGAMRAEMDAGILVRKVKWDPRRARLTVLYEQANGTDTPDEHKVTSAEKPHPALLTALTRLRRHVVDLCELQGIGEEEIEPRSVALTYRDGAMGVTITAIRPLRRGNAPLVLHTPFLQESVGEEDQEGRLPSEAVQAVEVLIDEALLFLPPPVGRAKRAEPDQAEFDLGEG